MFEQAFKNIDDVLWKEAGLFLGTGLHRADVVAAVLEVPGWLGAGPRHRGPIAGEEVRLDPGQTLPLGRMGGSQDQGRPDRPQPGPDRRRPPRLCQPEAVLLPARIQAAGQRAEYDRIQDRRDFRRDQKQDPERLQPARDHRPRRRTAVPLADREARTVAPVRGQDPEHGQRRAERRRVLHAAAADPRHCPGRPAQDRRSRLRRRLRLGGILLRVVRFPQGQEGPDDQGSQDTAGSALSSARRRSPWPT